MEFGALVPQGWRLDLAATADPQQQWATIKRVAQGLDQAGWDSLWVYDHFHTFPDKRPESVFEAWMMMATLAEITEKARIGQFVTCMQYREPAYLAKIASCVDVASGGRLNVGVGSGWLGEEFEAYGYDFRTTRERLHRLEEGIEVLLRMWAPGAANYDGKRFQLKEAFNYPKPVSVTDAGAARPPLWIGGRGPKVLLRLVAQYADVWNYNGSMEEFDDTVEILKGHCKTVGRDFDEIRLTVMGNGIAHDNDDELATFRERVAANGIDPDRALHTTACKGSREQCAEFLGRWKAKGVDGIVFYFHDIASFGDGTSQAEIFRRDILPTL
jgi:F420-dependent oxidoreductase-like protein